MFADIETDFFRLVRDTQTKDGIENLGEQKGHDKREDSRRHGGNQLLDQLIGVAIEKTVEAKKHGG